MLPFLDRFDPVTQQGRQQELQRGQLVNEQLAEAIRQSQALFDPTLEARTLENATRAQANTQQAAINPLLQRQLEMSLAQAEAMNPLFQRQLEGQVGQQEAMNPLALEGAQLDLNRARTMLPLQEEAMRAQTRSQNVQTDLAPTESAVRNALLGAQAGQMEAQTGQVGADSALRQQAAAVQLQNAMREQGAQQLQLMEYMTKMNPNLVMDPSAATQLMPGLTERAPFMSRFNDFQAALSDPGAAASLLQSDPQLLQFVQAQSPDVLATLALGGDTGELQEMFGAAPATPSSASFSDFNPFAGTIDVPAAYLGGVAGSNPLGGLKAAYAESEKVRQSRNAMLSSLLRAFTPDAFNRGRVAQ